MSQVLKTLVDSPEWAHTAVIFTYDEHGGFYDHVPPPEAVVPDDLSEEAHLHATISNAGVCNDVEVSNRRNIKFSLENKRKLRELHVIKMQSNTMIVLFNIACLLFYP